MSTKMRLNSLFDHPIYVERVSSFWDAIQRKMPKEINRINVLDGDDKLYHDSFEPMHYILHRSQQFTIKCEKLNANRNFTIGEMNLLLIDEYWHLE